MITKADGTKGYLKAFARSLQPMAAKTVVLRGRNGEPKRDVNLQFDHPLTLKDVGNDKVQETRGFKC